MQSFIQDFGILFLVIVAISFLVKLLKQPIIIGYILSGFIFSFFIAGGSSTEEQILLMAELGITFLLFLMGLEFDFHNLKYLGKDIFISTTIQSALFFTIAYSLSYLLGFSFIQSAYLAILFMFSSTLLVAKWLEDKKETSTLHGKITLGILIVQDVLAILILTVLNLLQETSALSILFVPLKGLLLLFIAVIFVKYLLNHLLKMAHRYPELLFVFSLGVCFLFAWISPLLGYSTTIGAFIAGVTLANTEYKNDILSRLKPLIIFFNLLFFVGLGFQITTNFDSHIISLIILFFILCFLVKPIIIYLTLKQRGYDLKTSFMVAVNLSQFSEFGIIIISAGIVNGLVSGEVGAVAIILVVLTLLVSSYFIKYDQKMFKYFEKYLRKIDSFFVSKEQVNEIPKMTGYQIIFFGYYDLGKEFFAKLEGLGKKALVVENDRANIHLLKQEGIPYLYGSVSNPYFLDHMDLHQAEIVVSSVLDADESKTIIKTVKGRSPKALMIVTAKSLKSSLELYDAGADYVIYPSYLNEQNVSVLLEDYTSDINKIITKKINDLTRLKVRQERLKGTETMFNINDFMKSLSLKKTVQKVQESAQSATDILHLDALHFTKKKNSKNQEKN
ncbi:MAG TPA: cation:proton antiporter [Candidatus Nanoarchaeia archaeon]|nr:cation:proton antiporter [Candidatus Nanoarchaeia archaeon]